MNKDLPPDKDQPDTTLSDIVAKMDKTREKRKNKLQKKLDKLTKKEKK